MDSKPVNIECTKADDAVGGRTIPQCQPCSKNKRTTAAHFYCRDCKEFQCCECSAHHKTFAIMFGHNIIDWEAKVPEANPVNMFGLDKCQEHGNSVTIYCEDHGEFCCPTCGFSGHKLCEKAKMIQDFSVNVTAFQETSKACNEKASQFMNTINDIGNAEMITVKEKAEKLKAELIQKINSNLTEALEDIQTLTAALKSTNEEEVSKVYDIQGELELWKNSYTAASELGSHDQCFILCKSFERRATEYNEFLNKTYDNISVSSVHAECHQVIDKLVDGGEKLAKLAQDNAFIHETGSEFLEEKMKSTESSEKYLTYILEDTNDNQRQRTVHLTTIALLHFREEDETNITGIDFMPDDRLLALDNYQKQCFLLDENCQILGKKFTFDDKDSYPFDVCVYRENKAVVTTTHNLYFLQIDQQNSITLNHKVETQSCYYSITIFNCSMFLCNTFDNDNGPVRAVDFEGKEMRFIETAFPDIKYGFEDSFSTYTTTGIIVLADRNNNKVHLFNILSGRGKTIEDDRIQQPTMACVAPDGSVFVNCLGNDAIVRISPKGEVLQALNTGFKPWVISISKDEKLVVSGDEGENRRIQLYKLAYL